MRTLPAGRRRGTLAGAASIADQPVRREVEKEVACSQGRASQEGTRRPGAKTEGASAAAGSARSERRAAERGHLLRHWRALVLRTLLWLVPEEAIEFDLAHFNRLELTPSGVARLVEPIKPGTGLAGGLTYAGAAGTRLLLRTPEGETLRPRIAPELRHGALLRLVLDTKPQTGDEEALRWAVAHASGQLPHHRAQRATSLSARLRIVAIARCARRSRVRRDSPHAGMIAALAPQIAESA